MIIYALWALLLMSQSFANTLVSRARNSSSVAYHSVASLFSNGVYFVSLFILVDSITATLRTASVGRAIALGCFYTLFTLLGSILSHWLCMRYLERGKRAMAYVPALPVLGVSSGVLTVDNVGREHRDSVRRALGVSG